MKQVFLSYARLNSSQAARLFRDLCAAGSVRTWFDRENLLPGMRWRPAIRKAIRESDYFIALLSREAVSKRGFRNSELRQAIDVMSEFPDDRIFLIPTRLNECKMPDSRIDELTYADLFPRWKDGVAQLCRALGIVRKRIVTGKTSPPPTAVRRGALTHHYRVGLVDLDSSLSSLGRIARGLSRVQRLFGFDATHLTAPRSAMKTLDRSPQLYLNGLTKKFYARIAPLNMDFSICLTKRSIAFADKKGVHPDYIASASAVDEKVMFVSYALLERYSQEAGISFDTAVAFLVTGQLVDYFLDIGYHDETRNCPMDFDDELSDLIGGLRAGRFCPHCLKRLRRNPELAKAVTAMINWGR